MNFMKKKWLWGGIFGGSTTFFFLILLFLPYQKQKSNLSSAQNAAPEYKVSNYDSSVAYTLKISKDSGYSIRPLVAETVETVARVGQQTKAIAVMNAGFFDPANQKTTSRVVINHREVADPRQNERLMNNPDLSSYLDAILNRSEFRQYRCGATTRYDITVRSSPTPVGCELEQAIAGGPQLLPSNTAQQEGFTAYKNGELIRDAIGTTQPNARTAIGITAEGNAVWVMIAQKVNPSGASGMTLAELTAFLKGIGVKQALNLDGGTSSSLYFNGQVHYGKLDAQGQSIPRAVKSMLVLEARSKLDRPKESKEPKE
jgi:exopolysaccharide biosynthesis protein